MRTKKSKFLDFYIIYSNLTSDKLLKIVNSTLIALPTPTNISLIWNFGSILGLCLVTQILTGVFLAMHYCSDTRLAFNSVDHVMRDVNSGWLMRIIHANGARMFFVALYLHIARGIYYNSFKLSHTWIAGSTIFIIVIATAFLGYVLPWGQISFWGATVITNLFSAIPYIGDDIVFWLWGGFAVSNPTLTRFFSLHFLLPFIVSALVMVHLMYLHQTGSNNPLGTSRNLDKLSFHPYFSSKDVIGYVIFFILFRFLVFIQPWILGDPENFIKANPLVTPIHIQPEWYFLFAYAILRSIPNKLGGVLALFASVLILYLLPFFKTKALLSLRFNYKAKVFFWALVNIWVLLTWIGARPVEDPYILVGQALTFSYFLCFMAWPFITKYLRSFIILICGIRDASA